MMFDHIRIVGITRLVTLVLSFGMIAPAVAQQPLFPFHVEGENVDQYIIHDDHGRPLRVTHYAVRTRQLSPSELFFHQMEYKDTTITYTEQLAWDTYEWGEAGDLISISRWGPHHSTGHYFGPEQEIVMRRLVRERTGRVGEEFIASYTLHNRSSAPITLTFIDLPEHVLPFADAWTILPGDTVEVSCRVRLRAGEERLSIHLDHGRGRIPLRITTYGYHMRTDDLTNEIGMLCPLAIEYYRTGTETLLEVVDPRNGEVIHRYPLHSERTLIDLQGIGSRELEFCARDYTHGTISCASIAVE